MTTSVLIVHGALGSAAQMEPLAAAVRGWQPAFDVQLVELPGHGDTSADDASFTMATFAAVVGDTAAAAAATHGSAPVVFGYSMGGYAALLAALTHPERFAGIVTYGSMFDWTPDVAAAAARRLDPTVMQAKVPAFAAQLAARHAGAGGWARMLTRTAALLRALGDDPPLTGARLASLSLPVRLLVGERDDTVSYERTAALASTMPAATAVRIADAPHPIEQAPLAALVDEIVVLTSAVRR